MHVEFDLKFGKREIQEFLRTKKDLKGRCGIYFTFTHLCGPLSKAFRGVPFSNFTSKLGSGSSSFICTVFLLIYIYFLVSD